MKAYILAAGYATRMYPLTRDLAKPLLEVAGAPILTHIVRHLVELPDLSELVEIGNDRFADALSSWADATPLPVPVRVLNDGSRTARDRLGAVGDLAFALRAVPLAGEDWIALAGDNLVLFDLRPHQRTLLASRRPTLLLRENDGGEASRYNEVTLGEDNRVVRFREKPRDPRSQWAAIAVYLFPPEVAPALFRYLAEGGNPDAPGHFIAWLVEQMPVGAVAIEGEWFDIGSIESLEHARRRLSVEDSTPDPAPQKVC